MDTISDELFDESITEVMKQLPQEYISNMKNVAIVMQDEPSVEQKVKLKLRCNEILFGLYEGIPLTQRGANYQMVLPDKITLFKLPLLQVSSDLNDFKKNLKRTLWHEIAHHYGLNHERIHKLEDKGSKV